MEQLDSLYFSTVFAYYGVLSMSKSTHIMASHTEFDYSKCVQRNLEAFNWSIDQSIELCLLMGMNLIYTLTMHDALTDLALLNIPTLERMFGTNQQPGIMQARIKLLNTPTQQDYNQLVKTCGYKAEQLGDLKSAIQVYSILSMESDVVRVTSSLLAKTLKKSVQFQSLIDTQVCKYGRQVILECQSDTSEKHWSIVLIGLHEFWHYYEQKNYLDAIKTIDTLALFPLNEDLSSVRDKVSVDLGKDIVGVIGGILVATMNCLVGCWRLGYKEGIRSRAAALILYTSGINVTLNLLFCYLTIKR